MSLQTSIYTTTLTITLTPLLSSSICLSVPECCPTAGTTLLHPFSGASRPQIIRQISHPNMGTDQSDQLAVLGVNSLRFRTHEPQNMAKETNTDLAKLKATATRLKLSTRRSSYLAWLEDHLPEGGLIPNSSTNIFEKPQGRGISMICFGKVDNTAVNAHQGKAERDILLHSECKPYRFKKLILERRKKIEESIRCIRTDLQMMTNADQVLARKLLHLYQDIHRVRLSRSCQEHREHLDEVRSDLEESNEFSNVLDLPRTRLLDGPLKQLGVTRLNINTRRFSTC